MHSVRFLTEQSACLCVCVSQQPEQEQRLETVAAAAATCSAGHKLTICSIQSFYNGHSLTQGNVGKPLNMHKTNWCKPLIVTVCNNKEVIYQLLSATHSWTVSEEQFETLDQSNREHKNPTLTQWSKPVSFKLDLCFSFSHHCSARQHGTICFPLLHLSRVFCPFLPLSVRLIFLSARSLHRSPLGWSQSAVSCTLCFIISTSLPH